ncbi:MAG: FliH/SctL family protein [Stenotrophobium sp.]
MKNSFDVFPQEQAAAATRWQLPSIVDAHAVAPDNTGLHTAADLDQLEAVAYEEGHARGYAEGLQSGQREVREMATQLQALLEHLSQPLADIDIELEHALTQLTVKVARKLINDELQLNPKKVAGAMHEAIAALSETPRELRVHLHPEDVALLTDQLTLNTEAAWKLVADTSLARGDCRIVTDSGQVDARLDTRQANLERNLLGEEA